MVLWVCRVAVWKCRPWSILYLATRSLAIIVALLAICETYLTPKQACELDVSAVGDVFFLSVVSFLVGDIFCLSEIYIACR